MLEKLSNKGNFQHNCAVVSQGLKVKQKSQTVGVSTKHKFCQKGNMEAYKEM